MKKFVLAIIFLIPILLSSQTVLSIRNLDYNQFPLLKAQIRAVSNAKTVTINKENLLVVEGVIAHRDFTISPPENGWQNIEWYPDHNVIDEKSYTGVFAFTNQKETSYTPVVITGIEKKIGTFIFKNASGEKIHDLQFVDTEVGDTSLRSLSCVYFYNLMSDDGQTNPIKVDSLTITNDNFLFEWRGNQFNNQKPPVYIIFPNNQILVRFAPKEEGPQSAILKVHYNGGAVAYIRLQGNKKKVEAKTNLTLTFPNGGETFTPCQDTIATWKGNVKSIHTKAELSYNNGRTWVKIDSSITDTLGWKIPPKITSDSAKFRISQDFTKNEPFVFKIGSGIYSVDYNYNATKALTLSIGEIYEWDLKKLDNSKISYNLQSRNFSQTPISIKYISNDRFAVIYSVGNFDSLAVFEVNNPNPIHKESFYNFKPREIYRIPEKNEFIILSANTNYFKVYDNQSLSVKQEVLYNEPITGIGIAKDTNIMVVSGLDSKVFLVSKNDFQTKDSIEFYRTPIIDKLSISPNGKFIGVSSLQGANSGRTNSMLWDLESRNIITSLNISGSQAVDIGFSPTSNMAIFAYQYQNQINIFDLVKSSQSGIIEAFQDPMYGLAYSTENNSFLVSSVGVNGPKFKQYFFTFPETDESDGTFRIVNPIVKKEPMDLSDGYIFDTSKKKFSVQFCNTGEVPLFIEDAYFKSKVHFGLENFALPDTIAPGECIDLTILFNPKDTGMVSDSLILASCSMEYPVYVKGNGLNRNIEFLTNNIDLGEVCINDTTEITTDIFRNADPVPLLFNKFSVDSSNIFTFINYPKDTLLEPGQVLKATLRGVPNIIGDISSNYTVLHSNQEKYKAIAKLTIKGIGTYVEISNSTLPFIPEQRIRQLSIKNIGKDPILITNTILNPLTDFKVNTLLPVSILPGETKQIEIEWIGNSTDVSATLKLDATPCLTQSLIKLIDYNSESLLTINDTHANPLDTTSISINFNNDENANYGGVREFEAIVTIDPKIFIPEYAVSEYGDAKIENLGIEDNKRLMKLTVNGDFPASGTLAKIIGYPGLSEVNTSTMLFYTEKSKFWGKSSETSFKSGLFTLLLTCNDQTIIHDVTQIVNITPNPITNTGVIEILNGEDGQYELLVSTNDGRTLKSENIKLLKGRNLIQFNSDAFETGNYILSVKKGKILSSKNLVILK
ncbi:WD40 repeat domain-containing protein [bacterium]|nr:MAG: WD40 repeat domain-containing protein [bacterium]